MTEPSSSMCTVMSLTSTFCGQHRRIAATSLSLGSTSVPLNADLAEEAANGVHDR
eukprot:CAMPEP_0119324058 /NCGR_PEP_ID=MMETSP1333-20130426/62259_1 /TAXON_ID=418940 /ORGANISM="Scyphosphaera apsteinii, Strain RCC1455" /LENGTH=54 /DNA_ID=CAMNT_0007331667 /DNA_START=266 /DNA_END=433 /DNA_ORIENTATION=-